MESLESIMQEAFKQKVFIKARDSLLKSAATPQNYLKINPVKDLCAVGNGTNKKRWYSLHLTCRVKEWLFNQYLAARFPDRDFTKIPTSYEHGIGTEEEYQNVMMLCRALENKLNSGNYSPYTDMGTLICNYFKTEGDCYQSYFEDMDEIAKNPPKQSPGGFGVISFKGIVNFFTKKV